MSQNDRRVDAYITKSADFAKPILKHLRRIVHAAAPDVQETMKWGFPHFMHKGILCGMGAFKEHCTFGFWKSALVFDGKHKSNPGEGMGQFGRITAVSDLPKESVLAGYVRNAVRLNDDGIKTPARPKPRVKKELVVPDYLTAVLKKNQKALKTFENFSYSHKKEYVEWITEAKREETRQQRLETMMKWLSEGKSRHWKYARC
jgi:uncharacterized protein YdeI (YjbR/CyaY-like superfamily)